jgi:hypothetical protein
MLHCVRNLNVSSFDIFFWPLIRRLVWRVFLSVLILRIAGSAEATPPSLPAHIQILSRQLRVDLIWTATDPSLYFQIRRSREQNGPFTALPVTLTNLDVNAYSDFVGETNVEFFYQMRSVSPGQNGQPASFSDWSPALGARPQPLDVNQLLTDVQEAGFRYFYNYATPFPVWQGLPPINRRFVPPAIRDSECTTSLSASGAVSSPARRESSAR